jgi:hypothetical protein
MKGLIAALALLVVLGVGFFLYSSPAAPPAEMTEAEVAQIEAEVSAVGDQWIASMNAIDVTACAGLFDPAGTHGVDGAYYANYEEWVEHLERLFSTWEAVNVAWTNTRVDVLASDAAMFVGEGEGVVTRTERGDYNLFVGTTLLAKRIGDEWKLTFQGTAGRWTAIEEG